jgi:hypothetical protein
MSLQDKLTRKTYCLDLAHESENNLNRCVQGSRMRKHFHRAMPVVKRIVDILMVDQMKNWRCSNREKSSRIHSWLNILVMGRACFLRVPVSEANDLNFLLCRCIETGYASRLGNNETKPTKQISLNSAMKNRAPNNPIKPNLLEQRRAGRWC